MIKINIEDKEALIEEIIKKNNLSKKQLISYSEFLCLYEEYKEKFTKEEFAQVLGIKKKTFRNFVNKLKSNENKKICILVDRVITVKEQQIKILQLVKEYSLHKGKKIDYELFMKMHEEVKSVLTQEEFGNLLGITEFNIRKMRQGFNARVFMNMKLNDETIQKIRKDLIKKYEGKKIYYKENTKGKGNVDFLKLYEPYKLYFTELEFAKILGISEKNLWYAKNKELNPTIKDIEKVEKIEEIKKLIVDGNFYSKHEIEKICKQYGITQADFINYLINKGKFFNPTFYEDALEKNEGIYIGKGKISNEDIEKYQIIIERILRTIISSLQSKYPKYHIEDDFKIEALEYIIYNCNDLIINFKHNLNLMERAIWMRTNRYTSIRVYNKYNEDKRQVTLKEEKTGKKEAEYERIEEKMEIESINIDNKEELIELFKYYLEQGYNKEEIIEDIARTFQMEKEQMLEMVKEYLLEKGRVVKNKKGEYQIGEK